MIALNIPSYGLPSLSSADLLYSFICHMIAGTQNCGFLLALINNKYLRISKTSIRVPLSFRGIPKSSVIHVVSVCAHPKVGWIAARPIVATMKNMQSRRDRAPMSQFPCMPMCKNPFFSSWAPSYSVAGFVTTASEHKAITFLAALAQKFVDGFSHFLLGKSAECARRYYSIGNKENFK